MQESPSADEAASSREEQPDKDSSADEKTGRSWSAFSTGSLVFTAQPVKISLLFWGNIDLKQQRRQKVPLAFPLNCRLEPQPTLPVPTCCSHSASDPLRQSFGNFCQVISTLSTETSTVLVWVGGNLLGSVSHLAKSSLFHLLTRTNVLAQPPRRPAVTM